MTNHMYSSRQGKAHAIACGTQWIMDTFTVCSTVSACSIDQAGNFLSTSLLSSLHIVSPEMPQSDPSMPLYLTSSNGITHLTDLDTRSRVLTLRFPHSGNASGLEEHLADDTIDTECATFLDSRTRCIGRNVHSNMVLLHCIQFRLCICRRCICETNQAYGWNIFDKASACDSSKCQLLGAPQICLRMAK